MAREHKAVYALYIEVKKKYIMNWLLLLLFVFQVCLSLGSVCILA